MNSLIPSELELVRAYDGDFLIPRGDECIGSSLKLCGQFETSDIQRTIDYLERTTKYTSKKHLFIDIGANIGTHTISALKEYMFCNAIAVEPSRANYRVLTANLCLSGLMERATCIQAAASNRKETKSLFINPKNCGDYRLGNNPQAKIDNSRPITEQVNAIDIGGYLRGKMHGVQPEDSLCWIDTQGHEVSVLLSLHPLLKQGMPAVFEFWPYGIEQQGGSFRDLQAIFDDIDLRYAVLTKKEIQLISVDSLKILWDELRSADTEQPEGASFTNIIVYKDLSKQSFSPYEKSRIEMTLKCRDVDQIPKVQNAGKITIHDGVTCQLMHNGIKVASGGYYGAWMRQLIQDLQGHHEPQEEKVFHEIVKRASNSGLMIELGCFWSYYSLWFLKGSLDRKALGLEPDPVHLKIADINAKLNDVKARFKIINGIAAKNSLNKIRIVTESGAEVDLKGYTIKNLLDIAQCSTVEILHCDAQGAESFVVDQVIELGASRRLRFCIISTHAYEITADPLTHQKCLDKLIANGAHIIAEHDVHESFSGDGLIAASFLPSDKDLIIEVSCNRYSESLFPNPATHLSNALSEIKELRSTAANGATKKIARPSLFGLMRHILTKLL